jgi:hypothetical protein
MFGSFMLGLIMGGAAVWFYGREIGGYVDDKTRAARGKAADTLQAAAEGLQSAKETIQGGIAGKERRAG